MFPIFVLAFLKFHLREKGLYVHFWFGNICAVNLEHQQHSTVLGKVVWENKWGNKLHTLRKADMRDGEKESLKKI